MISQPAPYTAKVWGVGLDPDKEVENMDGIFVVEVEYEEVRKVLLEEMEKCSTSDIPMYLRNLELIKKLKDEDGIAIRLDSLLTTRSNELRSRVREQVIEGIRAKKERLGEMKEEAVSDVYVDVSEAEVTSELLGLYDEIAERNEFYIMVV